MAAACCSRTCASTPIGQSATSSPRPDQADRLSIRALFSPRRGVFDAAVSSASPLPNKEVPHGAGLRMLRSVTRLRLLQLCFFFFLVFGWLWFVFVFFFFLLFCFCVLFLFV